MNHGRYLVKKIIDATIGGKTPDPVPEPETTYMGRLAERLLQVDPSAVPSKIMEDALIGAKLAAEKAIREQSKNRHRAEKLEVAETRAAVAADSVISVRNALAKGFIWTKEDARRADDALRNASKDMAQAGRMLRQAFAIPTPKSQQVRNPRCSCPQCRRPRGATSRIRTRRFS